MLNLPLRNIMILLVRGATTATSGVTVTWGIPHIDSTSAFKELRTLQNENF